MRIILFNAGAAADASGDKATALRGFQDGVKAAMAFLNAQGREHRAEAVLELYARIMKRVRQNDMF